MKSTADRTSDIEKAAFSERLKKAIAEFDDKLLSPTVLSREFSRRSRHSTIGVTTAHKWLAGDAIPQQEKLTFLANWLRVPVQWLRYGETSSEPVLTGRARRRQDKVLSDFGALSERDKVLIEKLMKEMLTQKLD